MQYLHRLSVFRDVYHAIGLVFLLLFAITAPIWVTVSLLFIMHLSEGSGSF